MKTKAILLFIGLALFFLPAVAFAETGEFKEYAFYTEHFQIEYDKIVQVQVDSDSDGIPDTVEDVGVYAEESWDREIDDLGFDPPIESGYIPIIFDDEYEYLYEGSIGTTWSLPDLTSYIAVDVWLTSDLMKSTIAHEFMHCIQFSYDPYFLETYQSLNFAEATAVWAEEYVYDEADIILTYLQDYFAYPDYSIFAGIAPNGTLFEYALGIWPIFLTEYYEDDEVLVDIWETYFESEDVGAKGVLTVYNSVSEIVEILGDELPEVYREFTIWNLAHDETYQEGENYPDVSLIRLWSSYPVENKMPHPQAFPALYGSNYIGFDTSSVTEDDLKFTITKNDFVETLVTFVPADSSGNFYLTKVEEETSDVNATYSEFVFEDASDFDIVYVIVSPVTTEMGSGVLTFDTGYAYYYSAEFGDFDESEEVSLADSGAEIDTGDTDKEGEDVGTGDEVREVDELILEVLSYDDGSITLEWNRLSQLDIDHYILYFGDVSGEYIGSEYVENAWTVMSTISELAPDTIYYFTIEAYSEDDELLISSSEIAGYTEEFVFGDLESTNDAYDAVMGLWEMGVIDGYDDGNFYPNNTVNRAELLKILVEGLGLTSDPDEYKDCFPDVDDDWYAKYVCYAKEEGWVSGYSDGYFHPEDTVNKVEAVKMLLNAYGYEVSEDEDVSDGMPYKDTYSTAWYAGYVKLAFDLSATDYFYSRTAHHPKLKLIKLPKTIYSY
ncbi:MAG: hypothetical protein UW03_C0006G0031 [Candidatus Peregrinibacteria bacterium GW2011_GWA2_43_8]|nr:MAG: hypothetical protein UW03_C0006G0031 [Candidatus Peregrinibacteria bacterium GW2011_GWA2_43_8]